ncbi:MAG: hypothetical protein ABI696_15215 [Rubrivivax sp.]
MFARGPVRPFAFMLALAVTLAIVAGVDALASTGVPDGASLVQRAAGCAAA